MFSRMMMMMMREEAVMMMMMAIAMIIKVRIYNLEKRRSLTFDAVFLTERIPPDSDALIRFLCLRYPFTRHVRRPSHLVCECVCFFVLVRLRVCV